MENNSIVPVKPSDDAIVSISNQISLTNKLLVNIERDKVLRVLDEKDSLFEDAARVVVKYQMSSVSLIQRRLKLDFKRATRLMEQLGKAGIVGENRVAQPREVKYKTEAELDSYLAQLK